MLLPALSDPNIADGNKEANGKIQANYLDALFTLYVNKFERICWWWKMECEETKKLLGVN